jgi:hypothetical protein
MKLYFIDLLFGKKPKFVFTAIYTVLIKKKKFKYPPIRKESSLLQLNY